MPNYHKLQVPSQLIYARSKLQQLKLQFQTIIDRAEAGQVQWAEAALDKLAADDTGLRRCADYWVFCVRFQVASRNVPKANHYLGQGFIEKAQPEQLLLTTQKFLQQLAQKLELNLEASAGLQSARPQSAQSFKAVSRPTSSKLLDVAKNFDDIRDFWRQSQTLVSKKAAVRTIPPDFLERLAKERQVQENWDWSKGMQVLSALDQIKHQ